MGSFKLCNNLYFPGDFFFLDANGETLNSGKGSRRGKERATYPRYRHFLHNFDAHYIWIQVYRRRVLCMQRGAFACKVQVEPYFKSRNYVVFIWVLFEED